MLNLLIACLVAYAGWWLWKGPAGKTKPAPPLSPNEDEAGARAVLGLDVYADEADIRAAHRRLIAAVHPDRGGSPELARRINAARDVLLRRIDD